MSVCVSECVRALSVCVGSNPHDEWIHLGFLSGDFTLPADSGTNCDLNIGFG